MLHEDLISWQDWDSAQFLLGLALGLWGEDDFPATKHVFWTRHVVGEILMEFLDRLAAEGVLLRREEPCLQYKVNPDYRGSWENRACP